RALTVPGPTAVGRVAGVPLVADDHYSRGKMRKEELSGKTAAEAMEHLMDFWKLALRKYGEMWALRDVEWWIYDRADLPESRIAQLERSMSGGPSRKRRSKS
ncbi:MAG: hypothetical protein KY468_18650, partial [Armatimonadetes bacterium]|nr:hypothetical protein [Armatimonadota bacterium]